LPVSSPSATASHTLSALDSGTSSHINIWPAGAHVFALSGRAAPGTPPARLHLVLERGCPDPSYVTKSSALLPCPQPGKRSTQLAPCNGRACPAPAEMSRPGSAAWSGAVAGFRFVAGMGHSAALLLVALLVSQGAEEEPAYSSGGVDS
jgi:hypothetical protein